MPAVTDVAQIDASGRERLAVSRLKMDAIGSGRDRSREAAFREARVGKIWFGPLYFRQQSEPYMPIAVRSKRQVAVAQVNLKFIWDVIRRIKVGKQGRAYVVDAAGDLIADPDIGKVTVVGAGMRSHPGVAAAMFEALADAGINIEIISTSPIRISCVVRGSELERAVQVLHERFRLAADVVLQGDAAAGARALATGEGVGRAGRQAEAAVDAVGDQLGLHIAAGSALAAGVTMGIMIIPFVSSLSDDVITAVPRTLRDGSLAMGATKSETVRLVVLPAALPGIIAAVLLAVSRAIGETMIVVMAAGLAANLTANPFEAVTTVTVQIVTLLVGDQEFNSAKTLSAFALGLLLFVMTLALNLIAIRVVQRYRERYE